MTFNTPYTYRKRTEIFSFFEGEEQKYYKLNARLPQP